MSNVTQASRKNVAFSFVTFLVEFINKYLAIICLLLEDIRLRCKRFDVFYCGMINAKEGEEMETAEKRITPAWNKTNANTQLRNELALQISHSSVPNANWGQIKSWLFGSTGRDIMCQFGAMNYLSRYASHRSLPRAYCPEFHLDQVFEEMFLWSKVMY